MNDQKTTPAEFDADLPPTHPHNEEVAQKLAVRFDKKSNMYRDVDGAFVFDKFGQPL